MAKRFRFEYVYDSLVLSDNGQPLIEVKGNEEEKQLLLEVLNEMHEEKKQFKSENIKLTVDNKELKCTNNELYQDKEQLKDENKQLKQELRFIQSELHNASFDVRERTLKEVSDEIEKLKRYE